MELTRIGEHARAGWRQYRPHLDRLGERGGRESQYLPNQVCEVERFPHGWLPAGEEQNLPDEIFGPPGCLDDLLGELNGLADIGRGQSELCESENCCQDIVKVVRDATR